MIRMSRSTRKRVVLWSGVVLVMVFMYVYRDRGPVAGTLHEQARSWLPLQTWLKGPDRPDTSVPYVRIAGFCLNTPSDVTPALRVLKNDDIQLRMRNEGMRTCCDVSVTEVYCRKSGCEISLFGKSYEFQSPVHLALFRALRTAYQVGTDYFLLCKNCTSLPQNWAEKYITTLNNINPPNLGMGVPTNGDYLFFHRTHIDVFGYAFPWKLPAKDIFQFLYNLYPSQNRIWLDVSGPYTELRSVEYTQSVHTIIREHRPLLSRYVISSQRILPETHGEVKLVSMSLYGDSTRYVEGAIRNAQLASVVLPDWILRFYVPHPDLPGGLQVRPEVLATLRRLGAELKYIDQAVAKYVAPMMWRFLIVDDRDVDVFLIQDSDSRLGPRVAAGVEDWLTTNTSVYCMRDHPWHAFSPISGGMWGARRQRLSDIMHGDFVSQMTSYNASYQQDMKFLSQKVWKKIRTEVYCHDSVSCNQWPNAHPWPVPRQGLEHVGEIFNEFHQPLPSNRMKLYNTTQNFECEPERRNYFPPPD